MAANQAPAALPDPIFEVAFRKLKDSVTKADADFFQSTKYEDVWKAAEDIERMHREKRSLKNMRRIEPFLKGLQEYSKVVEVLCNGTPYLPWIWAPIKLMLQVSSGYLDIFDKLLNAYRRIAEVMPQLGRLQKAFEGDENFKLVLGMVYSDILDFHGRAYKFFRRRSWHIFFDSMWKSFEFRFAGILDRLARHRDLLMKEAFVIDVTDSRRWREKATLEMKTHADETTKLQYKVEQDLKAREKQAQALYLHDSIAWLKVADEQHDDELEELAEKRQDGTCEWVFKNELFKSWQNDVHGEPILWVKGIPGAGKTILSTYVIRRLQEEGGFTTAYHICNSYTKGKILLGEILRSISVQILRANIDLAPYIFDNYANKGLAPSIPRLRRLLPELLSTVNSIRIIVDGLDEYPESDQRVILADLIALSKPSVGQCKVLFSNRDEGTQIRKVLTNKPTIDLKGQFLNVSKDIEAYVKHNMKNFREEYEDRLIDNIEKHLVNKAGVMFLWVRLVIQNLEDCGSERELVNAVNTLPDGLDEAYGRILHRVKEKFSERSSEKAVLILEWVACSFRILKSHEIQDGILFHTRDIDLDERSRFRDGILDLCKPLIETGPKNTVDFVHYSAKEYILHNASGPFLKQHQAHYDLSLSCMNYLLSSKCFFDNSTTDNEKTLRVLKGFHSLHQYANEFWFQHLLQYAKSGIVVQEDQLEEILEQISIFWKEEPGNSTRNMTLEDKSSPDRIEIELEVLDNLPQAQSMLLDILRFRQFLSQEKYIHQQAENLEVEEVKRDPTNFSSVSQQCQSIVQSLIDCTEDKLPEGALPDDLKKFKEVYTDTAFICRSRECVRHFEGFTSAATRDEHEASHTKPLRCADPACEFFSRGFTSKKALENHNRKNHPSLDEIELPKFEPRRVPDLPISIPAPEPVVAEQPPLQQIPRAQTIHRPGSQMVERKSRAKRGLPVHACEICGKIFNRAESLRRHTATHGNPSLSCSEPGCDRAFFREDLLERHSITHRNPEFLCPYESCGKAFYFLELLGRHVITHGPRNFACSWENCECAFHFADALRRHENSHSNNLGERTQSHEKSGASNKQ